MTKVKHVFVCAAALAGLTAFAGAQTSNTNTSTAGTFSTDFDNYMSVNDWQSVQPQNVFGAFGFKSSAYELGAAKQFGSLYLGTYFTGDFGNLSNVKTTTEQATSTVTEDKTTNGSTDQTNVTFDVLGGIGGLGIKLSSAYTGSASTVTNNTTTTYTNATAYGTNTNGTVKSNSDTYADTVNLSAQVGYNMALGNIAATPNATFTYKNTANKTTTTNTADVTSATYTSYKTSSTVVSDSGTSVIGLAAASGFAFPAQDIFSQYAYVSLGYQMTLYPSAAGTTKSSSTSTTGGTTTTSSKDSTTTLYSAMNNTFSLTPKYVVTVKPSDTFAMKFAASLPVSYNISCDGESVTVSSETSNSTTTTTTGKQLGNLTTTGTTTVKPALALCMVYQLVPEKLQLNAGAKFSVPSFTYTDKKVISGNTETSTAAATTTKTHTFICDGSDDSGLTLSSGFLYSMNKNVNFDCTCSLLSDILGSTLASKWYSSSTSSYSSSFWENMDKVFFPTVSMQVTAKL